MFLPNNKSNKSNIGNFIKFKLEDSTLCKSIVSEQDGQSAVALAIAQLQSVVAKKIT